MKSIDMWNLLYYSFKIDTNKPLDDVQFDLQEIIYADSKSEIQNLQLEKYRPYKGRLNSRDFTVKRTFSLNSLWATIIHGTIKLNEPYCSIEVKVSRPFIYYFFSAGTFLLLLGGYFFLSLFYSIPMFVLLAFFFLIFLDFVELYFLGFRFRKKLQKIFSS